MDNVQKKDDIIYNGNKFDRVDVVTEVAMRLYVNTEVGANEIFGKDHSSAKAEWSFNEAEAFWDQMCKHFPE